VESVGCRVESAGMECVGCGVEGAGIYSATFPPRKKKKMRRVQGSTPLRFRCIFAALFSILPHFVSSIPHLAALFLPHFVSSISHLAALFPPHFV
jgi:hypothetical protein